MKTLVVILTVLIGHIVLAQDLPVLSTTSLASPEGYDSKTGNYSKDTANERQQYVGLWKYEQGGVLFELKIELKNKYLNYNPYSGHYNYTDVVILKYKLVKNNEVLHDNLNEEYSEDYEFLSNGWKMANYDLEGRIMDYYRQVWGQFTIKKLTTNKILFTMHEFNYRIIGDRNDSSMYNNQTPLFSLPLGGIEMTRVVTGGIQNGG